MTMMRRMARWWWLRLPLGVRRVSVTATGAMVDGYYLMSWPRIAAILSPAALVAGLLVGWQTWGFETVMFESLTLVVIALVIGSASAHLGLLFSVGFAVGNFFLHHNTLEPRVFAGGGLFNEGLAGHFLRFRLSLIIAYVLLALLAVVLPLLSKSLTAELSPPMRYSRGSRVAAAVATHAFLSGAYVYLWSQSYPLVIRPVFEWTRALPPVSAIAPIQTNGTLLFLIAAVASIARILVQGQLASRPLPRARQDVYVDEIRSAERVVSWFERTSPWLRSAAGAGFATLMMAGVYENWIDALIIGIPVFVLNLIGTGAIPVSLERWSALVNRVPLAVRLGFGLLVVFIVARLVIEDPRLVAQTSFRPILVITAISFVFFFLLNPRSGGVSRAREQ